jgi:predicted amidohydrolase
VKLSGTKIGILICGELYNHALADRLAAAKPDLVANLCHRSMTRFTKSLHRVAETVDCRVLHVQHVALHAATVSKWEATSRGASADSTADWVSYTSGWKGEIWAEVKVWKL